MTDPGVALANGSTKDACLVALTYGSLLKQQLAVFKAFTSQCCLELALSAPATPS